MTKKEAKKLIKILKQTFPDAKCSLNFKSPFQLLVAVMLSAQCTDERVNKVTPKLFERCKTIEDFASIDITELENLIKSCGFYKNKAANIKSSAKKVLDTYNAQVPKTMDELLTLPGIGRKSANVIMLEAFGIAEGIAIDTHAKRISNKLGLSSEKEPEKIEQDLLEIFDKEDIKYINHLFMWLGRNICIARNPKCIECSIKDLCNFYKNS